MMSPKKQIDQMPQVAKKDGRMTYDQINANQALVEMQKHQSRFLPSEMKSNLTEEQLFNRDFLIRTDRGNSIMRSIDLTDEALLHII